MPCLNVMLTAVSAGSATATDDATEVDYAREAPSAVSIRIVIAPVSLS